MPADGASYGHDNVEASWKERAGAQSATRSTARRTAVYDKPNRTLELRATVAPELVPEDKNPDRARPGRGCLSIAGAGFEPATFGL
jgi:hypothetical protein